MSEETFEQAILRWINHLNESLPNFKELIQAIKGEGQNEDQRN